MWEEAIDVFKSLNQLDDNNVASHYALSLSYLKLDKKEEANKELLKVLELDPKHTVCMFNLAQLYLKEKKCDDAIFWYKKLLATDAKFVSAYFGTNTHLQDLKELLYFYCHTHTPSPNT